MEELEYVFSNKSEGALKDGSKSVYTVGEIGGKSSSSP
jgi:hypothetical protein